MGRGANDTTSQAGARLRGAASAEEHQAHAVAVELWIRRAGDNAERVSVEVRVSGYDDARLRSDYPIPEAEAEVFSVPFSLELLRGLMTRELAEAVADELAVAYREPADPPAP